VVSEAVAGLFPDDPPRFLARLPHGYFSAEAIAARLGAGPVVGRIQALVVQVSR
jgi:hypothetical protein